MSSRYTPREELFNSLTHGIGTVAAAVGAGILGTLAVQLGDPWLIGGVLVFGITLVLLYTASTLYHSATRPALKARFKILDHACIYLLIAGTYTPFTLGPLRGNWGWTLFIVIWTLALGGVVFKLFYTGRFNGISTIIYVVMGWLVVAAAVPMLEVLSRATLTWMMAGGISYTAGTLFYTNRSIPYSHAIWHLFVLGGSTCHAIAVATILSSPVGG